MKRIFLIAISILIFSGVAYSNCTSGDCQNGKGELTIVADGGFVQYSGEFKNGMPEGQGRMKKMKNNILTDYTGQFKNGRYHGYGTLTDASGSKTTGRWIKGKSQGK